MSASWCRTCDQGLPAPDCIIYLDLTVEEAAKRGNYGEERYEKEEFQKVVRQQFMGMKEVNTHVELFLLLPFDVKCLFKCSVYTTFTYAYTTVFRTMRR